MTLECPGCRSRLKLDPAKLPAGATTAVCPRCKTRVLLPGTDPAASIVVQCESCRARLKVNVARLKPSVSRSKCPKCGRQVSLPAAPPRGADGAAAMTRRIDAREMGLVLGAGREAGGSPALDDSRTSPIPVEEGLSQSADDLSRLIDEKVDVLGTETVPVEEPGAPVAGEPEPGPPIEEDGIRVPVEEPFRVPVMAKPPEEEELPLTSPGLPDESPEISIQYDEETPPEARASSPGTPGEKAASRAEEPIPTPEAIPGAPSRIVEPPPPQEALEAPVSSRVARGSSSSGSRRAPSFSSAVARPAPSAGAMPWVPLLVGGLSSGAVIGLVVLALAERIPEGLLPSVPDAITSPLGLGERLGTVLLTVLLAAAGSLMGGISRPPGISILRCAAGTALLGLLGGLLPMLDGSFQVLQVAAWTVQLLLAGLVTAVIARLLAGSG